MLKFFQQIRPIGDRARRCVFGLSLCGLAGLLFVGCKPKEEAALDPVVVTVGSTTFTVSEIQGQIEDLEMRGSRLPDTLEGFLDVFVERQLAVERAMELGLDDEPELRRQYENLLIGRLQQYERTQAVAELYVKTDEVEARYAEKIATYTTPAKMRIALLEQPYGAHSGGAEDAVRRLEEARSQTADLSADARGFGELAMRYSEEARSRFKGGDVGWVQEGAEMNRWPLQVLEAAFDLEADRQLSEVIACDEAAYLVMRLDARAETRRELTDSLYAQLEQELLAEKRRTLDEVGKLDRSSAIPVEVNDTYLSKIQFKVIPGGHANAVQLQSMPTN